jgi:Ca-activated chloride channel family protein
MVYVSPKDHAVSLTFDTYWPLLLLALIPYLWVVQRRTTADLSPKHLQIAGAVRSLILILLILGLMQPVLKRSGDWISAVYLVDVSESVSPSAIQNALQWIEQTNNTGRPNHARFIPFGSNSQVLNTSEELKSVSVSAKAATGSIDQSETALEDAVDRALRSFAPHHLKRLILVSDGNENSGHVTDVLPRLKQEGVHVYTVPMQARTQHDVWVEDIMMPANVAAEEAFPVEVHVYSQVDTPGEVEVKNGDKSIGKRQVQLVKGLNRIAFDAHLSDDGGPVTLEASVKAAGDPINDNNVFRQSVVVEGKPRILYIEGHRESAKYLQTALQQEGFKVDAVQASVVPDAVDRLDSYDLIVLSDVARSSLTDNQMKAVATYVRDLGGGFILAGGENNFGQGGYSKTIIEDVLPVTFETKKEKPNSTGMIVVLDKSGSMGGQKIELAKEATKAPLDLLKDTDKFGVVAFDYNFYWPVRFQDIGGNRGTMNQAISSIIAGGETNIYPALREAYIQLAGGGTEVKHVILLSDGRSLPDDYQGLVTKMTDAKITVSTVAVGSGSDRELLQQIAQWGKGRTYYIEDATRVPQIFTQETEMATGKTLKEEPFKAQVKKTVEAFKGIDFKSAPNLLGYVTTKAKDTSEVLLEAPGIGEKPDPLLARWQYGLGKTAAFTSDLKDRWAVDWLKWSGYPKFWSQLVRETMRRRDDDQFDFRVLRENNEAHITINAVEKDGHFRNKLQTQVRVIAPDQKTSDIPVRQIGPGSYETKVPLTQKGTFTFRAIGDETGGPSRVLPYSYPEEYHFYPPNTELLRAIATETGGSFQPNAAEIFNPHGETTALPTPLWPYLALTALLLYVTDVLLRRLRLFE